MLAERFCKLKKEWEEGYNDLFAQYYATVHRLETNKLRNVAKIFGHLMHTGIHTPKVLASHAHRYTLPWGRCPAKVPGR